MKIALHDFLVKFDQKHAAFYAHFQRVIMQLITKIPKWSMRLIHWCETIAENTYIQHAVIITTIFVLTLTAFNRSDRYFATTDALPNNLVALNILFNHRIDLTNLGHLLDERDLKGIYIKNDDGTIYPKTSVLLGIISAPFFYMMHSYWGVDQLSMDNSTFIDSSYSQYFGKFYASFLSALSAVFMYIVLTTLMKLKRGAFWLAMLYAFCTNVFNIAAQSSIQHAPSIFLITGAMVIFFKDRNTLRGIFITSSIIALSTHIRISNGFYLIFFGLTFLFQATNKKYIARMYGSLISGFLMGYIPLMLYLKHLNVPNGYLNEIMFSLKIWSLQSFFENMFALLFSYNYGLFFFSPVFLIFFIIILMKRAPEKGMAYLRIPAIATIALFVSFASSWWMWSGGLSLGARLIIEAIPLGILLIGVYYESLIKLRWFPLAVVILGGASLYFNFFTSFAFDKTWHDTYTKPGHESQIRNAWYTNPPFLEYMMHNQFYFMEKLRRVEIDDKPAIEVRKQKFLFNGYDGKVKKYEPKKVQILPIPK